MLQDRLDIGFRQAISSTKTSKISIAQEQGVLPNLRRIHRAANTKEFRSVKPSTDPYVRVNGSVAPMSTTAALKCLDQDYEQDNATEAGTGFKSCMSFASSAKSSQSD